MMCSLSMPYAVLYSSHLVFDCHVVVAGNGVAVIDPYVSQLIINLIFNEKSKTDLLFWWIKIFLIQFNLK